MELEPEPFGTGAGRYARELGVWENVALRVA